MTSDIRLIAVLVFVTSLVYLIGYYSTPKEDIRNEKDLDTIANDFDDSRIEGQ